MEFPSWNRYLYEFRPASYIYPIPGVYADAGSGNGSGKRGTESHGLSAMIKWPNDAVVNGKKICGILTEMSTEEDAIRYVVPGIGINVNATEFPEEIRDKATSLKLELGRSVKRSDVICAVAESFEEYYEIFEKTCDMSGLLSAYDEMLVNMEKTVCV